MDAEIFIASSDKEVAACFAAFSALRPHIQSDAFLGQVRRQEAQGFRILALRHDGIIKSAAGFREVEYLAWGRVLYLDDLTTLPEARGQGFAGLLLDRLISLASESGCGAVHLDTGYTRHAAHKLYLSKGFELNCHHLARPIL